MTETYTNKKVIPAVIRNMNSPKTILDHDDQILYELIKGELDRIKCLPDERVVSNIISYSRSLGSGAL